MPQPSADTATHAQPVSTSTPTTDKTAPTRLDAARSRVAAAEDELSDALTEEIRRTVDGAFPTAAWLVVDPARWRDDPRDQQVEVRAVVDLNGTVLHAVHCPDFPTLPGLSDWKDAVEDLLTDYADLESTSGWPEVCSVTEWDCDLRAVALTDQADEQECPAVCEHPAWP